MPHILIKAFRYALPRDKTCSGDFAETIIQYWDIFCVGFQEQIKRDILSEMEHSRLDWSKNNWEKVLKLKNKNSDK